MLNFLKVISAIVFPPTTTPISSLGDEYGDLITHLPIDSDRIVGVQFSFQLIDMPVDIFIFSVYFPSTTYPIDEYKECFSLLWVLFETYCDSGPIIILGNLDGSWE